MILRVEKSGVEPNGALELGERIRRASLPAQTKPEEVVGFGGGRDERENPLGVRFGLLEIVRVQEAPALIEERP